MVLKKKTSRKGFRENLEFRHFVGTENTVFAVLGELVEKLPSEGSFAESRKSSDDVKPGGKDLILVEIIKAGFAVGKKFHGVDVLLELFLKKSAKLEEEVRSKENLMWSRRFSVCLMMTSEEALGAEALRTIELPA